jgi:hypothetical protein
LVRYGTGGDGVAIGVSDGGGGDAIVGWAIDADLGRDVGEVTMKSSNVTEAIVQRWL